jgi:cytochrome c oxidase cbb3-type subunit III
MKSMSILKVLSVILFGLYFIANYSATLYAAGDPAKGKETFNTTCASCHGTEGKGDGVAAAALDPKPRDLSDAAYVSTLTDEHIFKVVKEGGASVGKSVLMPPWGGVLSDDKIWDVIAYIRNDICKCQHEGS